MNWKHVHNFRQKPVPQPISLRRNYRLPIKRLPRKSIIHTQCTSVASVLERVNACTLHTAQPIFTCTLKHCADHVAGIIWCERPFTALSHSKKLTEEKNKHFKKTRKKKRVRKLENKKNVRKGKRMCCKNSSETLIQN